DRQSSDSTCVAEQGGLALIEGLQQHLVRPIATIVLLVLLGVESSVCLAECLARIRCVVGEENRAERRPDLESLALRRERVHGGIEELVDGDVENRRQQAELVS